MDWIANQAGFADIGFEPDGQVRYSYAVTDSTAIAYNATATHTVLSNSIYTKGITISKTQIV